MCKKWLILIALVSGTLGPKDTAHKGETGPDYTSLICIKNVDLDCISLRDLHPRTQGYY